MLLQDLEKKVVLIDDSIGSVFIDHSDYLKIYAAYCSGYNSALEILENCKKKPSVNDLLLQCELNPKCKRLPLESFLIKPVQVFSILNK